VTLLWGKIIWFIGVVGWAVIRHPHARRSRRTRTVRRAHDLTPLIISSTGMFLLPAIYALGGQPRFASYPFQPALAWLGAAVFIAALWLFYRTHKDLGRQWSVTLEIREQHALVTHGVYRYVRHPMYAAFFLWALAQALLLPNWIAGPAGIVGFGTLFFFRIGREERLMEETFGDDYRRYVARTGRIVPRLF
jgi:protein-S-isoprenylcysteine O-methyltransferase Ste14